MQNGRVLKQQNGLYTIEDENGISRVGNAGSKIRKEGYKILAGDFVEYILNTDNSIFINSLLERKNSFIRPPVANLDTLFIVVATDEPAPDFYNIDSMLSITEANNVNPIIVVNKIDIKSQNEICSIYEKCGYKVYSICGNKEDGIDELKNSIEGVCAFAGQSGVGKSTIMNQLFPELLLEVGEISQRIQRGKNTTRITELFKINKDTYVADTPGFGMIDFINFDLLTLEQLNEKAFPEFTPYKNNCKFRNCTHLKEESCAVISAVRENIIPASRHENFIRLHDELSSKNQYK
ncbi:MAG: ribosome small subunit-dependent GTPase A [Clostridiales bacterium GWF2_38_85]|nr:MAG: ribosome small subunit-dependent GTPase A [Clostridiales bacterium GWF2_38_85]